MSHSVILTQLANSGWSQCPSIARALAEAGIPVPTEAYLRSAFDISVWDTVATLSSDLSRHFQSYPFAEEAIYGPLLVPHARLFDVRRSQSRHIRSSQPEITKPDFVDERLPFGADHTDLAAPWTLFVTIISDAGLAMGSYNDITAQPRNIYTVNSSDTRQLMTRQLWCALVLQNLQSPDCEQRKRWTSTLFAGEALIDGSAVSGTVLHGQVRQRLGKATRGSSPMRIRPALHVGSAAPMHNMSYS